MLDAVWDLLTGAVLLGWFTTALFGAVAGAAVAVWARVNVVIGLVVGFLFVFPGIAALLVVGGVRGARRRRERVASAVTLGGAPTRAAAAAMPSPSVVALPALPPAVAPGPAASAWDWGQSAPVAEGVRATAGGAPDGVGSAGGFGASSGFGASDGFGAAGGWGAAVPTDPFESPPTPTGGWVVPASPGSPVPVSRTSRVPQRLVATPAAVTRGTVGRITGRLERPTWPAITVAVLALLVAAAFAVTTQLTWVSVRGLDGAEIFSVGPFGLQLGLFVAGSAVVAGLSGLGVLVWRSAWWSVLCAWCAAWWIFLAVEALSVSDSVAALNRFVQSTVSSHTGYEQHAALLFGDAWTFTLIAAVALLATSVALVVLQHRGTARRPA